MEVNIEFKEAEESDYPFLLALRTESMNPHILNAGLTPTDKNHLERIEFASLVPTLLRGNAYRINA